MRPDRRAPRRRERPPGARPAFTRRAGGGDRRRGGPLLLVRARARARRRCSSSASCAPFSTTSSTPARILAITFTDKAAGELRERIRGRFVELGDREPPARREDAWISTIHGFCSRLLRAPRRSPPASTRRSPCSTSRAPRALRDGPSTRRWREFLARRRPPTPLDLVAAYGPTRCAARSSPSTTSCAARGQARPAAGRSPRSRRGRRRTALAAAPAAAGRGARWRARLGKRVDEARVALDRCARCLERRRAGDRAVAAAARAIDIAAARAPR